MFDSEYRWHHKHLLDVTDLSREDISHLLSLARNFQEINERPVKKVPVLKGKSVILFFVENSTRTKTSFDVAAKRLSADTFSLGSTGSSLNKGESLKDTGLTLAAMNPDIVVIRHSSSGAAKFLADRINSSIINAGDGWHAHPTQALLDLLSLDKAWNGNFNGKTLTIAGDIAHSRVARSNVHLLEKMGVKIRICAPKTLLPPGIDNWPVKVFNDLEKSVEDADGIMALRLQLERQQAGLLPALHEYSRRFCINKKILANAKDNAVVLHPGPMNRGLEISDDIADNQQCLVTQQVSAGVAIRMALLYLLAMSRETGA